ncbi:MAG: dynamin family protein [Candidatus Polarisedimenticolaceae bacterium]|nr:dynamin family protein [Candidatus Polarisedimenticolaceae bacterium]
METTQFQQQLHAYKLWKADIIQTIEEYGPWLKEHDMYSPEAERRINHTLDSLRSDRLTIAFVAEFSRGKTELINAIFFADYGRRLLPSGAGRTTMCPSELFYDDLRNEAYVRLLPIETRLQETTLNELKKSEKRWVHYPLDANSAKNMEKTLQEVGNTKRVTIETAQQLGLYNAQLHEHHDRKPSHIDIPKWRHALISFPHPLLKQGLTILDTPGLNALGSEPELTLSMLPSAQAILFVLAADTGVTQSDMEMWKNHIKGFHKNHQQGVVVALNKIDNLWDELKDEESIAAIIHEQCHSTAEILGVKDQTIFPVSAKSGLIAKIRQDESLLEKSALPQLEEYLSKDVLGIKQQIILDTVGADVGQMLESSRGIISGSLNDLKKQLEELEDLSGKSDEVINSLMEKTRIEQSQYLRDVDGFQTSRKRLKVQAKELRRAINLNDINALIVESRHAMSDSWTTLGLKSVMRHLFEELRSDMQSVVTQSEQTRKLVRGIYQKFQNEHGFTVIQPKMFSVMKYRVELELLHQEAELFRNSPITAMMEQSFVIKRFFTLIVNRANDIFHRASEEIDLWLGSTLEPLVLQIKNHKNLMEKRLANLQKIGQSRSALQNRVGDLQDQYTELAQQLTSLRNMYNKLNNSRPLFEKERPKPRLVHQKRA